MSLSNKRHDEDEWAEDQFVVERFVRATGLELVPGSLSKRKPPEPDVLCDVIGLGQRAFELSQVVDERIVLSLVRKSRMERQLLHAWLNLPKVDRDRLMLLSVLIVPRDNATLARLSAAVPLIIRRLLLLEEQFTGLVPLDAELRKAVDRILVSFSEPSSLATPDLGVSGATSFGDPLVETIETKLKSKRYEPCAPAELILWYARQPLEDLEQSMWPANLVDRIRSLLRESAFEALSVLATQTPRVALRVTREGHDVDS